jgi:tetratricopeptide (TPR) repeat protein
MTKLPGIALYNQDRFGDAEFVDSFVARGKQTVALLNSLRHIAKGGPTEHQILVGTRGMGKTSLLRRLSIGIIDDPELKAAFIPLRFREEQYNIISLDAFWRNCGESLAEYCEQQGNQALADRLDIAIETPEWRDADQALEGFLAACNEVGGRAILFLDNLDLILEGIGKEGCWKLRAALQKADGPIVVGAATALLAQGANRDAPFYEFFHPHMLEPLTEQELLACLNALATKRGEAGAPVKAVLAREPERVRALYVLTGGNPRILGLVYGLLEQADSAEIFADLEALLDQVTPFYKARIEEYGTPLQRAVIDGIALNWDPITSNALSKETGVTSTTLSPQLDRLKKDGLIEEVETSGTRAGFQLAERFLNIWYLMRHGTRKTKQRLRWFTIFLTKLFNAEELEKMAGDARNGGGRWSADHCEAVIEAYELKMLSIESEELQSDHHNEAVKLLFKAQRLAESGQLEDAIGIISELLAALEADGHQAVYAMVMVIKGAVISALGRSEDAIAVYDELIARFAESDEPALQESVAMALINKGVRLGALERPEDEIAIYEEVIARFGENDEAVLQEPLAKALVNKGITLGALGRSENAIAVYDEVIARFGERQYLDLQGLVAKALVGKGISLGALGRSEDAVAVYVAVIARFGKSDEAALKESVAMALINKGVRLGALNRSEDEIAIYEEVIARFGESDEPALQEPLAKALVNKGVRLGMLGLLEEGIAVYDDLIARFGESNEAWLQEPLANALVNVSKHKFWSMGQPQEAEAGMRTVLQRDPDNAYAKANLLWMLIAMGRQDEASSLMGQLDAITGGGRALMQAGLELGANNLGASFNHLQAALDQGLDADFDFNEDLLWYLRIVAERGYGERMIDWFVTSGNADRYAPVYGAFVAHVRGERFLLDLNPEVRGVAQPLYAKLSAGKPHEGTIGAKKRKKSR